MSSTAAHPRITVLLVATVLLAAACAGSDAVESVVTETPVATAPPPDSTVTTEPPVVTDPPVTEPTVTEPPVTEPTVTEPPATEPEQPDIEFGDGFGPYAVGVRTITIADTSGGDRNLTVDIWFPLAAGADGGLTAQQYTLLPGVYYESPRALAATPDLLAPDGPFPLVVYSHGSGGLRYIHSDYTEAIASNGYIVAAADHSGNTAVDQLLGSSSEPGVNALARPRDVTAVIDAFLNPESTETVGFVGGIDPGRIAVTGHSAGGYTAAAVVAGVANDLGEYVADERVGAIAMLAPATQGLDDERLASIDVPMLLVAGTDDDVTPIDPNVTRPWELSTSTPSWRVDVSAVEHYAFTDVCAYVDFLPTLPDEVPEPVLTLIDDRAEQACGPDDLPTARAQAITNTFAVAFFDTVFRDGPPITPGDVDDQTDFVFLSRP